MNSRIINYSFPELVNRLNKVNINYYVIFAEYRFKYCNKLIKNSFFIQTIEIISPLCLIKGEEAVLRNRARIRYC